MLVKEIMTPKVRSVEPGLSLQDAAAKMRDWNVGSIPVRQSEKMIGIVTDRDICCRAIAEGLDPATSTVQDIMSKDVTYCFDDQDCSDAAHIMEGKHIRRLAVLDRDESMVGVLSVDDLARCSHDLAGTVLEAAYSPAH